MIAPNNHHLCYKKQILFLDGPPARRIKQELQEDKDRDDGDNPKKEQQNQGANKKHDRVD